MSNLTDYETHPKVIKYSTAGDPTPPTAGVKLRDTHLNETTGEIFTCTGTSPESWIGSLGTASAPSIADPSHPSLLAMYTMDNISGSTLVDESGNGNDVTLLGSPTTSIGVVGNGMDFNGSTQYGHIAGEPALSTGAVSFWMKLLSHPVNAVNSIFFYGTPTLPDTFLVITEYNSILYVETNGNGYNYRNSNSVELIPTDTNWHHIVVQQTGIGNGIEMFINGVQSTINNPEGIGPRWFSDLNLAGSNMYLNYLKVYSVENYSSASLDQFRIFNRALTQQEVTELYNEVSA